jgi:putative DNA primase/helicase
MSARLNEKIVNFAEEQQRRRGGGGDTLVRGCEFTDKGNGERFASQHGDDVRYVADWGKHLVFDGSRWIVDNIGAAMRMAKLTCESIVDEEQPGAWSQSRDFQKERWSHYLRTSERKGLAAMLSLAQSEKPIPAKPEDFDTNIWLLNLENGTYDLEKDEFREAIREDLITKQANIRYDRDAILKPGESVWLKIFDQYFAGDQELIQFTQRMFGYAMTGDTSERAVFLLQGKPDAGKSTLLKLMHVLLGDYAVRIPTESLMQKRGGSGGVPNDIARLRGARLVSASETDEDKRLSEAKLKELSGNDVVTARFMRAEFFDFEPTHKLFIGTNHMPRIRDSSGATWNRIRLIQFNASIKKDEQDPHLIDKLKAESSGIFNWLLEGCRQWREHGLGTAAAIAAATEKARADQDNVGLFLEDCTEPMGQVSKDDLYARYVRWSEDNRAYVLGKKKFGTLMIDRGFDPEIRTNQGRLWQGISLKESATSGHAPSNTAAREGSEKTRQEDPGFWE